MPETLYTRHAFIVIVEAVKALAEAAFKEVRPSSQGEMFTNKLSQSGNAPSTHRWALWLGLKEEEFTVLMSKSQNFPNQVWTYDAATTTIPAVLAGADRPGSAQNLKLITGTITLVP